MSFEVVTSEVFDRRAKRLAKKYASLGRDLIALGVRLEDEPRLGTALGMSCYKVRLAITSKGSGKSGGARVITYVQVVRNRVALLTLYDKSERDTITLKELKSIIETLS